MRSVVHVDAGGMTIQGWLRRGMVTGWMVIVIWLMHRPVDSVALRVGNGLPLAALALIMLGTSLILVPRRRPMDLKTARGSQFHGDAPHAIASQSVDGGWVRIVDRVSCFGPWVLVGWVIASAVANRWSAHAMAMADRPERFVGDAFYSQSHVWWWITLACVWTSAKRVWDRWATRMLLAILLASGVSLSCQAIYQHWITIPAMVAEYERNPDRMINSIGMDAPPGSATRMVFENRLRDGGASASFALANSLAAVLAPSMLIAVAFGLRMAARHERFAMIFGWFAVVVVAIGLAVTRSRSATAAVVLAGLGGGAWVAWSRRPSRIGQPDGHAKSRVAATVWWTLIAIVGVSLLAMLLVIYRHSEWVAIAPASLLTRFSYWRATLSMAMDHPWFGVGPGNFQAAYPMVAIAGGSEQIADPHHFVFETLASAGWPAAIGLLIWLATVAVCGLRRGIHTDTERRAKLPGQTSSRHVDQFMLMALGTGVLAIWLLQFASLELTGAVVVGDVVAAAVGVCYFNRSDDNVDGVLVPVTTVAMLLHLCFSGGWSVPAIAVPLWMLLIALTGRCGNETTRPFPFEWWRATMIGGSCVAAAVYIIVLLWIPSRQIERTSQRLFARLLTPAQVERTLRSVSGDLPQDVRSSLWLAELAAAKARSSLSDRAADDALQQWRTWSHHSRHYGGTSASLERQLLLQCIEAVRRGGGQSWMDEAVRSAKRMVQFSPHDVFNLSQAAVIQHAAGDAGLAKHLADRARRTAAMTTNPEQQLSRQWITTATPPLPPRMTAEAAFERLGL